MWPITVGYGFRSGHPLNTTQVIQATSTGRNSWTRAGHSPPGRTTTARVLTGPTRLKRSTNGTRSPVRQVPRTVTITSRSRGDIATVPPAGTLTEPTGRMEPVLPSVVVLRPIIAPVTALEATPVNSSSAPPELAIRKKAADSLLAPYGRNTPPDVTLISAGVPAAPEVVQTARPPSASTHAAMGASAARSASLSRRREGRHTAG